MKKYPFIFPLAFAVLFSACQNTATDTSSAPEKAGKHAVATTTSMDTVPLETALMNIKHYQDSCRAFFNNDVPIQAYTIHAQDMLMALGIDPSTVECRYKHARVYIGLNDSSEFKLYFTPVVGADLQPDAMAAGRDTILKDADGNSFVMDLNAPCPNTCDSNSPLYNPK
jgi:hypothetical protein